MPQRTLRWAAKGREMALKYEVRFGFPFRQLFTVLNTIYLKEGTIDWVWVNQPEMAVAIKAVLAELGLNSTKILTYIHYFPIVEFTNERIKWDVSLNSGGLARIIMGRILEGCSVSDLVFVHSDFSREMLLSVARINDVDISLTKVKKVPIPADPLLCVDKTLNYNNDKKLVFGYPNRLYHHYGTSTIFTMLSMVNDSLDFSVWVTNPTNNCSEIRNANDEFSKMLKDEVMALAEKHNLFVLEDAAQAQGALYSGKMAGTIGSIAETCGSLGVPPGML